jgi:hypothetical protein
MRRARQRVALTIAVVTLVLLVPRPAYGDNCGSTPDCYGTIAAACAVVVAIFGIILLIAFWPQISAWLGFVTPMMTTTFPFTQTQLDKAFEYANTVSKLAHVFDNPAHDLDWLVEAAGGESEAMRQIVDSLAEGLGMSYPGIYEVTRIIHGIEVTIAIFLDSGIPKIGTVFVRH